MSDKQEANVIFAIHFDDVNDPRYKEITTLLMSAEMWQNRNLVSAQACDSKDEMMQILRGETDET